jgi:hypothetical protein
VRNANLIRAAYVVADVTVVADAGMTSEANQVDLQAAELNHALGARIPFLMWCANGETNTRARLTAA